MGGDNLSCRNNLQSSYGKPSILLYKVLELLYYIKYILELQSVVISCKKISIIILK